MVSGRWQPTSIEGVWRLHNARIPDERGSLTELWRASLSGLIDAPTMVQANLSRSGAGVLRGMHLHQRQADLWLSIDGRAAVATTDLRAALRGGTVASQVLDLMPGDALFVPAGVAHGFLALTEMALVYLVTNEYDGTDEHGFRWDDPEAGIAWPAAPRIVSERDRANPSLRDLIRLLAQSAHSGAR